MKAERKKKLEDLREERDRYSRLWTEALDRAGLAEGHLVRIFRAEEIDFGHYGDELSTTKVLETMARLKAELKSWLPDNPFCSDIITSGGETCVGCGQDEFNGHSDDCSWLRGRRLLGLSTKTPE